MVVSTLFYCSMCLNVDVSCLWLGFDWFVSLLWPLLWFFVFYVSISCLCISQFIPLLVRHRDRTELAHMWDIICWMCVWVCSLLCEKLLCQAEQNSTNVPVICVAFVYGGWQWDLLMCARAPSLLMPLYKHITVASVW